MKSTFNPSRKKRFNKLSFLKRLRKYPNIIKSKLRKGRLNLNIAK